MSNMPRDERSSSRLAARKVMFRRNSGLIRQLLIGLVEMPDQHLDRHAALHFEGGIDAFAGAIQHAGRNVGGDDLDFPGCPGSGNGPSRSWRASRAPGRWNRPRSRCARLRAAARRSIRPGMTDLRSVSKGWLSRKKEVSLVVMASTTLSFTLAGPACAQQLRPAPTRPASSLFAQDRRSAASPADTSCPA